MNIIRYFLVSVGVFCSLHATHVEVLKNFIKSYTRSATILEITSSSRPYTMELARVFPQSIFVLLCTKGSERIFLRGIPHNVIILDPVSLPIQALEILARCEHFDVVITEISSRSQSDSMRLAMLRTYVQLGDHCFVESGAYDKEFQTLSPTDVYQSGTYLHYYDMPKKGLDIARWNLHNMPLSATYRYGVESTFDSKFLVKKGTRTSWIPGINLITFIMLGGVNPDNKRIMEELKKYKDIQHNDLVVGNFIVQGRNLKPIDFNDAHRRVRTKKSIKIAIELFKDYNRTKRPQDLLNRYQKKIDKTLKR